MSGSLSMQPCCSEVTVRGLCEKWLLMHRRLILLLGGFLVFFILFFTTEWIFKVRHEFM